MLLLRITGTSGENKTLKIGPLIIIIGFGAHYTIIIVRSPHNSIDNYLGAYIIKYFIHKLAATLAVDRLLSPLLYNAYMVRRLAFPPPPPPPPPMVWFARGGWGGAGVCGKGSGPLELPLDGGVVLAARAHTQALRKQAVNPVTQRVPLFRVTL